MRIAATVPAPRFAGVYTFERRQADGSTTPITPAAVGDDDRLQAVLQERMADAERDAGLVTSLTSVTRLLRVGDRLVGVANMDLVAILRRRNRLGRHSRTDDLAALEQGVLQAYLAKHPPTPLMVDHIPDA